jgi:hypothetical protein
MFSSRVLIVYMYVCMYIYIYIYMWERETENKENTYDDIHTYIHKNIHTYIIHWPNIQNRWLDMPIIALYNAAIQKNHAWIFPLTDGCRCHLRLLHDHANELTNIPIIHVPHDHETWHCIHVFLNAYRKTWPACWVATSSLSRIRYEWHDWTCNSSHFEMQQLQRLMHESSLRLIVVVVNGVSYISSIA